jgi:small GTP-binding protein
MAKPQQILELEKFIGFKIENVLIDEIGFTQRSYSINFQGKIIGLSLWNCGLKDISFLNNYRDLEILCLYKNGITDLTPMNKLNNLTRVFLNSNQISDISPIRNLSNLTRIELINNKLETLPEWILSFNLEINWEPPVFSVTKKGIFLESNPFKSPPPEIIKRGNAAIKSYFDSLASPKKFHFGEVKGNVTVQQQSKEEIQGGDILSIREFIAERKLNELKILLVGDGGAGKTSLSKLLRDQTFDPHENQTHGINIDDWKVGDITAHLWDFGGQEIMRATHKFFLSKRSLYVLVLDNREERDEERWLKRIESFGGNSPILIVLNKCEQNASYDVDRRDLVRRYSGLQTQDFYFVSCADGQGIAAFKQGLIAAFKRVELINSVLPESWFQVKIALEQQQRQQHYISYDRYIEICQQQQIADTQTQDILARLLHDLGVSVHFEDLALLDTHVLDPKWITKGVYKIITSPQLTEQQGVLHLADLGEILKAKEQDGYVYPPNKYAYLLELMKKFELSYHLNGNAVLIPQLLKPEEPEFAFDDSGQVLRFQILYDYLDDSIMPRFIVALHQDIDNCIQWRKGVLLKNPSFNSQAVVRVNYQDRLLTIVVKGEQKRDYFAVIRKALQDIHASFEWKKTTS